MRSGPHVPGLYPVYAGPDDKVTDGVRIVPAFRHLFEPPLGELRYRGGYGGRGSAKSWQIARALLMHAHDRPLKILCAREFQSSIRDSVHALLVNQAELLGLSDFYEQTRLEIRGANGSLFIFKGLRRHVQEIKSTEGVDIVWVEEAEAVSEVSWRVLTPTIRKAGSEIWVSFNVALPDDATYVRFHVNPPKRSAVHFVSWKDNPYMTRELHEERSDLLERDPEAEAHVWGGEPWMRADVQVLAGKWEVEEFEPSDDWGDPLYGVDFGFAKDPTTLVRVWVHADRLWLEYAIVGQWDYDHMADKFAEVPGSKSHAVRCDNSRPAGINELKRRGFRAKPAAKWKGSVEDGIAHLRNYERIMIHPRCATAIQEARLWRYRTDANTGDVVPKLQAGHDHWWDGVRYALDPLIKRQRLHGGWVPGQPEPEEVTA